MTVRSCGSTVNGSSVRTIVCVPPGLGRVLERPADGEPGDEDDGEHGQAQDPRRSADPASAGAGDRARGRAVSGSAGRHGR